MATFHSYGMMIFFVHVFFCRCVYVSVVAPVFLIVPLYFCTTWGVMGAAGVSSPTLKSVLKGGEGMRATRAPGKARW